MTPRCHDRRPIQLSIQVGMFASATVPASPVLGSQTVQFQISLSSKFRPA